MRQLKPIPGSLPLFEIPSEWSAPNLSDLPDWSRCKLASLDTEFSDPHLRFLGIGARRQAKLCGYSFCLEGDTPRYIPLRHPGGNVDCKQGLNYLRDNLWKFQGNLLGANMNVDLDILFYEDIKPNYDNIRCKDICVRGPLIWELHHRYSLEAEAERWGYKGKDETKLKEAAQAHGFDIKAADWKKCIPLLHAKYIGEYAENDAGILIPVYKAQQETIDKQGLNEVDDLESQILPLILKMRQRGVRIDFDHLDRVESWSLEEEIKTVAEIKRLTKWDIGVGNCMAAARVAPALREIGVEVPKTANGQWSITSELLASIDNPVAKHIRYLRQVNKLRTTFVQSIRNYETGGRIHTTFRQIVGASEKNEKSGAAFGRFSSAHPNLQQQPARGKFASFWRGIYLPEPDCEWLSADFSAQEPRWTTHFASLLNLRGAKELAYRYCTDPRIDPHQAMADLTGLERKDAKTVFLGLSYNMGGVKLCTQSLKLPTRWLVDTEDREKYYFSSRKEALEFRYTQGNCRMREVAGEEGQEIIDRFHAGAPFLRELISKVQHKIDSTGVLRVLGGRHIHFPLKQDGSYDWAFKGLNRLIQATSGYHMKKALLALDKSLPEFYLQLTIHDEAVGSIGNRALAKDVEEVMRTCVSALVPFRVECEVGPNLGAGKVLCNIGKCLNFAVEEDKFFGCHDHKLAAA